MINPTVTKLRNKVKELEKENNSFRADIDNYAIINTELQSHLSSVVQERDKISDELLKSKSMNEMLKSELKSCRDDKQTLNLNLESQKRMTTIWESAANFRSRQVKIVALIVGIFGVLLGLTLSLCF